MNMMKKTAYLGMVISAVALSGCLGGGGGSSSDIQEPVAETPTPQQQRTFNATDENVVLLDQAFQANGLPGYESSSRWFGVLDGARYRIEVPANWDGETLVMYAHGFRGDSESQPLFVDNPPMREYLLSNGFAWAASSYSTNYYDVRAGVEDTNKLALAFNDIAEQNGRTLAAPSKRYITGVSMGGHVTAAAVELETQQTANNFVPYDGAAPMCGVLGDTALFDYFGAYSASLFEFGGVPIDSYPIEDVPTKLAAARDALWVDYSANPGFSGLRPVPAPGNMYTGLEFAESLKNLSGGERPIYELAFVGFQGLLQGFAGADGTVSGILNKNVVDTQNTTYRFESALGQPLTTDEQNFNAAIYTITPDADANALRNDGLRFIPKVNGELYRNIPVVTVHTLGDLFVPISMEQIYKQRMIANGDGDWVVQRAVRAPGHCDFTVAEFEETLDAMIQWEMSEGQPGAKPAGDDFLNPATVANADFGCEFTRNASPLVSSTATPRAFMPACPTP